MTADWLYPLSSKAGYYFKYDGGLTDNTSPSSFEEMVQLGATDDEWGAYKNWRKMQPGDRMWAYYGTADGDLGVVGLAAVIGVTPPAEPGGRATVKLKWDRPATMRLLANPLPAPEVRAYIPHPQGAAWAIPTPLAKRLLHHSQTAPERPKPPANGKYGTAVASNVSYTPPKKVTVRRRHDALLRPFEHRLISTGWANDPFDIGAKRADLAMRRKKELIVVEAKTIGKSTNEAVRAAFAQLAEYTWTYQQQHQKAPATLKWALFEKEPTEQEVRFLEDHDIIVTWASKSKRRFFHGPKSAPRAFDLGL